VLFDLRGKRRRFIQVVYIFLALIFTISFVGLGIGGEVQGGLFNALGIGDGNTGPDPESSYSQAIEKAEQRVQANPDSAPALANLSRLHLTSGRQQMSGETNEQTGLPELSAEARAALTEGTVVWEEYLATDPKTPDTSLANLAAQSYLYLENGAGAAEAQGIVAKENPTAGTVSQLALYQYVAGDIKEADKTAERALEMTPEGETARLEAQFSELRKNVRQAKQQAPREGGEEAFTNPLGLQPAQE
jgi:tetratricopeptide (TPR) repeat protein